jgi:predicted nucleic-acid-binding protein
MRAVDTNVLVRLLTRDDSKQAAAADAFVARGGWVPHLVLAEMTWVLTSVYDRDPADIATAVEMLLNHEQLTLQDADVVAAAVTAYRKRPALGFSDCLLLEVARKAGHLPVGTFDRDFSRLPGVERLSAQT